MPNHSFEYLIGVFRHCGRSSNLSILGLLWPRIQHKASLFLGSCDTSKRGRQRQQGRRQGRQRRQCQMPARLLFTRHHNQRGIYVNRGALKHNVFVDKNICHLYNNECEADKCAVVDAMGCLCAHILSRASLSWFGLRLVCVCTQYMVFQVSIRHRGIADAS